MKEGLRRKHYTSDEVKTAVVKWLNEQSTEFNKAGSHALIQMWNVATARNGDYVKGRDVIHRGPASFWCMIHVPV